MSKISVIVPVYDEEENINPLYEEISRQLNDFELVFVDDGSKDKSWDKIKEIALKDKRVKAIRFTRKFGQTQAIKAGIKNSTGEVIVILDSDLQNDPADIPKLMAELEKGYDLVSGWRKKRNDPFFTRVLPSKIANKIISFSTGVYLHDYGCSLKVYKREIIEKIDLYGEMHRFIPALCSYVGAKISEVEVNHRPRIKGKSKYGMIRIFKVILDLLTVKFMGNFMTKPIYFFGIFSFGLISVSSLFFLITLYNKWYNHIFVKDQPLFLVAIFLSLAGLQLGLIGIIAEMLTRIYYSSEKRDYYIKEKIL
ncbi:MAG TPA: glycosyltransferase family 2 protein [Elusimicrobiales bacterium]|nr:glycosyltransferase family 2 protein [Elusimicrobiales bacterium]HOL62898.1 glycosyltransferase family 2 protein [Elusimicrobiales bacterium]